jgi:hypothetical protein
MSNSGPLSWGKADIGSAGWLKRQGSAGSYVLTNHGRAALRTLLGEG